MRPAALLPLTGLPEPENSSPKSFFLKPMGSALFSIMLHAVLAGIALALSFGGGVGGGVPGDGSGNGPGSGKPIGISGILFLASATGAAKGAGNEGAAAPSPEEISTVENIPASIVEKVPVSIPEKSNSQLELDAIPIGSPEKPKQKKKPVRAERPSRPLAANKRVSIASQRGAEADAKAAADMGNGQNSSEQSSSGQSGAGGNGDATPGTGERNGDTPGGGSGVYSGAGGGTEGIGNQGIGFLGRVDSKPKIISRSKVRYPELARKQRITGHVLLRFYLDEHGRISQLHIVKAAPPGVFEEAALAAVRQWRFAPAMKDGRPIPYWVELPMPFLLK